LENTIMARRSDKTQARLRVRGEMSVYRAAELKQLLLDALEQSATLEVDLSEVTEFDSAGLQLLLWARGLANARQGALQIISPSPAVTEVMALLQLDAREGV
jgi:anti-anti-sigma factor